jgi:hypothetical protein
MKTVKISEKAHKLIAECATNNSCSLSTAADRLLIAHHDAENIAHQNKESEVTNKKAEGKKMENCPDCMRKDTEKMFADRDHKAALDAANARAAAAEQAAAALKAQTQQTPEVPDFDSFIQHCTTCPEHKAKLDAHNEKVRREYVEKISPEAVKELAKLKSVDLAPDTLTISGMNTVSGMERRSRS